jgi:Multicopper oxidase
MTTTSTETPHLWIKSFLQGFKAAASTAKLLSDCNGPVVNGASWLSLVTARVNTMLTPITTSPAPTRRSARSLVYFYLLPWQKILLFHKTCNIIGRTLMTLLCILVVVFLSTAASQLIDFQVRTVLSGCSLTCSIHLLTQPRMIKPIELVSSNGQLHVTLDVDMVQSLEGIEWSETGYRTGPGYNGAAVGPTLRVKPGDTLTVTLNNNLDPSPAHDKDLYSYVMDPTSDDANVTIVYNRLTEIGNIVSSAIQLPVSTCVFHCRSLLHSPII